MAIEWKTANHFEDKYISLGWDLRFHTKFPKVKYLSADTETKLYYNNKLLSESEAYHLYKDKGQQWIKENLEVRAYAFTLSDGENFALFTNPKDFLTACAMFRAKMIFWYNAKFDFAIFDYYILSNGWKNADDLIDVNKQSNRYGKLPANTYQSLDGDFGQRYSMRLWVAYKSTSGHINVGNFKMVDICNIFGGGLARNLEDWKIKDFQGNDIRKLEMDYVDGSIEDDLSYMINDTKGLHLLSLKINKTIKDISGYSLFDGDYITAGGLAKKTLLHKMFGQDNTARDIELFKSFFPLTVEEDEDFRKHHLYQGGKCLVNPYKVGKVQNNVYKYDVNSMYPDKMRNMLYPVGKGERVKEVKKDGKHIYIVVLNNISGVVKNNMIPVWQDTLTGDYVNIITEDEKIYMWYEEYEELKNWYDLDCNIDGFIEYKALKPIGALSYVDTFYKLKCENKGAIKNGAKLFLNSAYGKLAQRVDRIKCRYELCDKGYVRLVKGDIEVDEKSMLSVVVGSRITSLARVALMKYIRDIAKGDVAKNFIYCDTDSVHALIEYTETDDKALGKMKCEGVFDKAIYLAPKSYLMYNGEYEVHCKGVNTKVVRGELYKDGKPIEFDEALKVFAPNRTFKTLCGLNVKGGKALIYIDKMIMNDENCVNEMRINDGLEEVGDYIY